MKTRLLVIVLALALLVTGAAVVYADIGTVLWKEHCPAGASIMPYEASDGGVDVVCILLVRAEK